MISEELKLALARAEADVGHCLVPRPWTAEERVRNRELFLQTKREEWRKAVAAGKLDGVLIDGGRSLLVDSDDKSAA